MGRQEQGKSMMKHLKVGHSKGQMPGWTWRGRGRRGVYETLKELRKRAARQELLIGPDHHAGGGVINVTTSFFLYLWTCYRRCIWMNFNQRPRGEATHAGLLSKAGRGELRSRDCPNGPNWHLCHQACFLATVLQRAAMIKCITYTSGQVTLLLKTCQGLLIPLRVNLISPAFIPHPPLFIPFLALTC